MTLFNDPRLRSQVTYGAAVIAPIAVGAALYPARGHTAAANLALVFVIVTVGVAAVGLRGAAVVAALVSGLSFDYFCTQPYLSLRISDSSDVTTTVLLVIVGLAVGELATRTRRARAEATAGVERLHRIHGLSERIASGEEPDFIVVSVAHELRELLSLRDCRFVREPVSEPGARIEADGTVIVAGGRWQTEKFGLPTRRVDLPVRGGGRVQGTFLLTPTQGVPVDTERCVAAVTLADQLGVVLADRHVAG